MLTLPNSVFSQDRWDLGGKETSLPYVTAETPNLHGQRRFDVADFVATIQIQRKFTTIEFLVFQSSMIQLITSPNIYFCNRH